MDTFITANNTLTVTADALTSVDTQIVVALGTGDRFPAPGPGEYTPATLSNSTGTLTEIVFVSEVVGDTLTVARGMDGTIALDWPAGTSIEGLWISHQAQSVVQIPQLQSGMFIYSTDIGSPDHVEAVFDPPIAEAVEGMTLRVKVAHDNTGPADFDPGSGPAPIVDRYGRPLTPHYLVEDGVFTFTYDGAAYQAEAALLPGELLADDPTVYVPSAADAQIGAGSTYLLRNIGPDMAPGALTQIVSEIGVSDVAASFTRWVSGTKANGDTFASIVTQSTGTKAERIRIDGDGWWGENRTTDPAAPLSGVEFYFVNGDLRLRGSLAVDPSGYPRRGLTKYWGSFTLNPAIQTNWKAILENYGGGGTITCSGTFDIGGAGARLNISNNAVMALTASTFGGATFRNGRISITGGLTSFTNIWFEAPAYNDNMFVINGGMTLLHDFKIDGTNCLGNSLIQTSAAGLELRAISNDCEIIVGIGVGQQAVDADVNSGVKVDGRATQASTAPRVICRFMDTIPRGKYFMTLDNSKVMCQGAYVVGTPGAGTGSATVTGVDLNTETLSHSWSGVLEDNTVISFTNTGGAPPAPLVVGTTYFALNAGSFYTQVAEYPDGPPIDFTTVGTGTTTLIYGASGGGIQVRRLATCVLQGANTFELCQTAVVVTNGSFEYNDQTMFLACQLPLRAEYNYKITGVIAPLVTSSLAPNGPQFFRDTTPTVKALVAAGIASLCTAATNVLTVGGVITGAFAPAQSLTGGNLAGAFIVSQISGPTGGAGTYALDRNVTQSTPVSVRGNVATANASQCTIAADVVTIGGTLIGTWAVGMILTGGTLGVANGAIIIQQLTGPAGGAGTYRIDRSITQATPVGLTGAPLFGYQEFIVPTRVVAGPNADSIVNFNMNDKEIVLRKTAAPSTALLPPDVPVGYTVRVSDGRGNAGGVGIITVKPWPSTTIVGTINGAASTTINTNWGSKLFRSLGSNFWTVIGSV